MSLPRPWPLLLLVASCFAAPLAACASEPPLRPNIMRPVQEQRFSELASRVFDEAGLTVERDRHVTVNGKALTVDLAAAGHRYGILYATRELQASMGDAIPKRDPNSDALVVIDSEAGDRILVLYERDYMTDDLSGDLHSATTIAAESRIERDARDFLLRAVRDNWP